MTQSTDSQIYLIFSGAQILKKENTGAKEIHSEQLDYRTRKMHFIKPQMILLQCPCF